LVWRVVFCDFMLRAAEFDSEPIHLYQKSMATAFDWA